MGSRTELDLDAATQVCGGALPALLEAYYSRCESVWAAHQAGGTGRYVAARRTLADLHQVTGKTGRRDLHDAFEALSRVVVLADILDEATAAEPDLAQLTAAVAAVNGSVTRTGPDSLEVRLHLDGQYALPDLLGGVPWPNELQRTVTLTIRHAPWRDRRVRRLARVLVTVDELWADAGDLHTAVAALPHRAAVCPDGNGRAVAPPALTAARA